MFLFRELSKFPTLAFKTSYTWLLTRHPAVSTLTPLVQATDLLIVLGTIMLPLFLSYIFPELPTSCPLAYIPNSSLAACPALPISVPCSLPTWSKSQDFSSNLGQDKTRGSQCPMVKVGSSPLPTLSSGHRDSGPNGSRDGG